MSSTPPWSDTEEPKSGMELIEMARILKNYNTWDALWSVLSEIDKLPQPLSKEDRPDLLVITIKSNEKQCSICLKQFETGNKAIFMPCGDIFHDECIIPWIRETCMCPLCGCHLKIPAYVYKRNYEMYKKKEKEREDLELLPNSMSSKCVIFK
ncbi:PREDICTED: E3 ubiquitin-protein ligase RNF181-like [Trachymyrmex septentrionalis]|nr:PREDICTED: E3 ubiquitin-protein ligase RNF181-like [Trachymyrmex septentrionalis]